jgi:NAD(P)-dependent dehydrogenase (short-subunit alcohol dehydrogenase family)
MKPIAQENDRLGFIGSGYMGRLTAQRLLESGFKLIACDRDAAKAEGLIPYGGVVAQTVAELSAARRGTGFSSSAQRKNYPPLARAGAALRYSYKGMIAPLSLPLLNLARPIRRKSIW